MPFAAVKVAFAIEVFALGSERLLDCALAELRLVAAKMIRSLSESVHEKGN